MYEDHNNKFSIEDIVNLVILMICKNRGGMMGIVYVYFNVKVIYFFEWLDNCVNFDFYDEEYLSLFDDVFQLFFNGIYEDDVFF